MGKKLEVLKGTHGWNKNILAEVKNFLKEITKDDLKYNGDAFKDNKYSEYHFSIEVEKYSSDPTKILIKIVGYGGKLGKKTTNVAGSNCMELTDEDKDAWNADGNDGGYRFEVIKALRQPTKYGF